MAGYPVDPGSILMTHNFHGFSLLSYRWGKIDVNPTIEVLKKVSAPYCTKGSNLALEGESTIH